MSSIPGSGRFPGGGRGKPLQYSCLENSLGRGAWWATVHGVTKSWTRLNRLSRHALPRLLECSYSLILHPWFLCLFKCCRWHLIKMAALTSVTLHPFSTAFLQQYLLLLIRCTHLVTLPYLFVHFPSTSRHVRRRQWHPTPVLLPGKSRGWRSLVGCSPWGR